MLFRHPNPDSKVPAYQTDEAQVGPTADLVENGPAIPAEWVGKQRWNEILTTSSLTAFHGFSESWTAGEVLDRVLDRRWIERKREQRPVFGEKKERSGYRPNRF